MATYAEGDWDGDMVFSSGDLVAAFTEGGYQLGALPAINAVPEPSSLGLILLAGLALIPCRRRRA